MSNAELIEKAENLSGDSPDAFDLMHQLKDALEAVERERDEYMERFRNVSDANSDILDQLWAAQAVAVGVRAYLDEGKGAYPPDLYEILSQSPTDALQAHDRQVEAKALAEARRRVGTTNQNEEETT